MWSVRNAALLINRTPLFATWRRISPKLNYSSLVTLQNIRKTLASGNVNLEQKRSTTFFNKLTADELWKGCTSVSNPGRKRGRGGIRQKRSKDLNRGQIIGVGKVNMVWPGLNKPVMQGRELVQQQRLPEDPEREKKLVEMRDTMGKRRRMKLAPFERGWTGAKMGGRSVGSPDPIGEDSFDGFDTKVLSLKMVNTMTAVYGRTRRMSALVVTGNKNGLVGYATGKANEGKAALSSAKNRSGQRLVLIERYRNHTVLHDFYCQFGKTKIFVSKKEEGFGLVCHRAIKTICEVAGIKDLYAKVEGPTNLGHIVKAFFIGLVQQKTHEQLAEEKGLHLVEFREEMDYFPVVVASPSTCRTVDEVKAGEVLDFDQYVMGSRIVRKRKKYVPFFSRLPSYENFKKKTENMRNHDKVRIHLRSEYGEVRSFLTEKYPECVAPKFEKKKREEEVYE